MPKVTGKLTDFGLDLMAGSDPKLTFKFVSDGRPTSGIAGVSVLANRDVDITPAANSYFEAELTSTDRISPAGYYVVTLMWRDRLRQRRFDILPGRLYVPEAGGVLADLLRVPANPALVWTGPKAPANPSPGSWWQNPETGDLREYDGTGWNYKANLRGPAGYNSLGAAQDLQTLADYVDTTAGANPFYDSLSKRFAPQDLLPVNVRSILYGADNTGARDAAPAFNAALRGGNRDVYVPAGRYLFKSAVRLYKNTKIVMHPDAVLLNDNQTHEYLFVNGELGNAAYAAGYAGDGNLWITGGTLDNGPRRGRAQLTQSICIGHAANVLIENVHFRNNYSSHFIEINSTRNVRIRGCTFTDLDPAGSNDREAINVDYSYAAGFPAYGGYDGTSVDGLTVEGCRFDGVQVAVGTHSGGAAKHRNIRILNNTFTNTTGWAVHPQLWTDFLIAGNTFDNGHSGAVLTDSCSDGLILNNTSSNMSLNGQNPIFRAGGAGGSIHMGPNRVVANPGGAKYSVAYHIGGTGAGHTVDTRGADAGAWSRAHTVDASANGTLVDGTAVFSLQPDTAAKIKINAQEGQALMLVTMNSSAGYAPKGLYWARAFAPAGGAAMVQPIAAADAPDLNLSVGALTGTTGEAGKVTLSVDTAGSFYLENRTGIERKIGIKQIAQAW